MNKKFIRVLGLGVGLFLAGSLSVNAQKVSFNGERLSLKQAFEKIESVSKYKIAYNTSQLDVNKQVVLNQKNQDVLQILSDLLKGTNCVYQVNDNYIVITLKDDEKVKKIKGTIKDSAGEPIIGANVILKGDATVGSITDIDGNFDLSVPSNATLQVSYIGYNTQDVSVGNKSFLNVTLKEDTETLDEVVVVGYGSQKKVNVIGSIASVDSKALESRAVPDVSNMLTGQMSGAIPANIAAGISSLEEKSLGAIAKSGTSPIQDVLKYAEMPKGSGLYFVDSWMSSLSLPLCLTACGATIMLYQMGGGKIAQHPMMPSINPTVVSPFLYLTGNAVAYSRAPDNFDFDASSIMTEGASIPEMGTKLLEHLSAIASGTMTKMETLNYAEQLELYMEGPVL